MVLSKGYYDDLGTCFSPFTQYCLLLYLKADSLIVQNSFSAVLEGKDPTSTTTKMQFLAESLSFTLIGLPSSMLMHPEPITVLRKMECADWLSWSCVGPLKLGEAFTCLEPRVSRKSRKSGCWETFQVPITCTPLLKCLSHSSVVLSKALIVLFTYFIPLSVPPENSLEPGTVSSSSNSCIGEERQPT